MARGARRAHGVRSTLHAEAGGSLNRPKALPRAFPCSVNAGLNVLSSIGVKNTRVCFSANMSTRAAFLRSHPWSASYRKWHHCRASASPPAFPLLTHWDHMEPQPVPTHQHGLPCHHAQCTRDFCSGKEFPEGLGHSPIGFIVLFVFFTIFTDKANKGFLKLNKYTLEMFILFLHLPSQSKQPPWCIINLGIPGKRTPCVHPS